MNRSDRGEQAPIIIIMLSGRLNSSPTLPPTLFFSVEKHLPALCPPIF